MKLIRRLTLYLLLAVGVVFGVDTFLSVRSHLALFDQDSRRDERLLGHALARALERTWLQEGSASALEQLEAMDESWADIRIRLVYLDATHGEPFGPEAPKHALEAVRRERTLTHVRLEGEPDPLLYTYVPLNLPGDRIAAIELSEGLSHETRYLQDRIRRKLATAAVMALACGIIAWLVGLTVVGRPVQALVEKARRIGRGDFSDPLVLRSDDELSQLAGEMNSMAAELNAATTKIANETAARLKTLEQLRHADRLTTVGKLAAGLAHELGTPLNVVAGRAKMIATGDIDSPEEGSESARIIVEQAERMTRIVRHLLDFARRGVGEKRNDDLVRLARQTASMLEGLATKQGVSLDCVESAQPVLAQLDAAQIQQALTNLVVNAIHASRRGGKVSITVSSIDTAPADAPTTTAGPWAVAEVRDHGTGITRDRLPEIFDPFFTTKPVGEGTGLGLSMAYGIAQEHGGWIDVESEVECGSRFRIWLPQRDAT